MPAWWAQPRLSSLNFKVSSLNLNLPRRYYCHVSVHGGFWECHRFSFASKIMVEQPLNAEFCPCLELALTA